MKVSVIIPVYNIEKYVERCLESIVNQTYVDIEAIVVDDGSTDNSSEIVDRYIQNEKFIIIHQQNVGLSSARNVGMNNMSGEYVMFVDGDDYLEQDCIEKLVNLINQSTDIILFPYVREYRNESIFTPLFDHDRTFNEIETKNIVLGKLVGPSLNTRKVSPKNMDRLNTAWGKLYRKSILKDIKFTDTQVIGPEDCWFNIQVLKRCKCALYTTSTAYHYEKTNQTSLLHKYNSDLIEKRWRMYKLIEDFLMDNNLHIFIDNLNNRIVCEQFGLLYNISFSTLDEQEKKYEISRIIKDKRYTIVRKKKLLKSLDSKWRIFFKIINSSNTKLIYIMFDFYRKVQVVRIR